MRLKVLWDPARVRGPIFNSAGNPQLLDRLDGLDGALQRLPQIWVVFGGVVRLQSDFRRGCQEKMLRRGVEAFAHCLDNAFRRGVTHAVPFHSVYLSPYARMPYPSHVRLGLPSESPHVIVT